MAGIVGDALCSGWRLQKLAASYRKCCGSTRDPRSRVAPWHLTVRHLDSVPREVSYRATQVQSKNSSLFGLISIPPNPHRTISPSIQPCTSGLFLSSEEGVGAVFSLG